MLMQAAGSDATVIFHGTHPYWVRESLRSHPLVRRVGDYPAGEIMDPLFFDFQDHILRALGGVTKSSLDWVSLSALGAAFFGIWLAMIYCAHTLVLYAALAALHGVVSVLIGFLVMHGYNHGSFSVREIARLTSSSLC